MTTLKEQLRADLTVNLKAHNELATTTLRLILGEIQSQEKGGKMAVEFDDAKVLNLIGQEAKKRRDSAAIYADAGSPDRAERETAEADFLATYLPTQLTKDEIVAIVNDVIAEHGAGNFGLVMKNVTLLTKGRADGKLVSEIVRSAS